MSTRWYPLYQKGNPQLRIFLPNFWMKLVKPEDTKLKNVVQFHCSMQMTKYDIKNYLEKIYNVPVIKVHTRIQLGKTFTNPFNYVSKEDDVKVAYVYLPRYQSFEFPDLYPQDEKEKDKDKLLEQVEKELINKIKEKNNLNPGLPLWFQ